MRRDCRLVLARPPFIAAPFGDEIVRRMPNASLREVDGPHLLLQSNPAACAAAIREFVDVP